MKKLRIVTNRGRKVKRPVRRDKGALTELREIKAVAVGIAGYFLSNLFAKHSTRVASTEDAEFTVLDPRLLEDKLKNDR